MKFTIPSLWDNETVYILGGGPSLSDVPMDKLIGKNVVCLNNSYTLGSFNVLYFMDWNWFQQHEKAISKLDCLKFTVVERCLGKEGITVIERGPRKGFSVDPAVLCPGSNSGYGSIDLAFLLGGIRIILLAFDMKMINGKHNWHDEHIRQKEGDIADDVYESDYIQFFRDSEMLPTLKNNEVEVLNATPGSALDVFPIIGYEEAFSYAR